MVVLKVALFLEVVIILENLYYSLDFLLRSLSWIFLEYEFDGGQRKNSMEGCSYALPNTHTFGLGQSSLDAIFKDNVDASLSLHTLPLVFLKRILLLFHLRRFTQMSLFTH